MRMRGEKQLPENLFIPQILLLRRAGARAMPPLAEVGKLSAPRAAGFCSAPHQRQKVSVPKGMHCLTKIFGSGSLEQDSLIQIISMEKEKQTCGRSITTDFENDNVMRTKRARRWRNVLFQRSPFFVPASRIMVPRSSRRCVWPGEPPAPSAPNA
jgi:hypothetical protein